MDDRIEKKYCIAAKDILAIIISIIALGISIKSCSLSQQALEFTNRPYLALKPVKFTDSESYIKIEEKPDKLSYSVTVKQEITNLGKTPAINVDCHKDSTFNIGPGENHLIVFVNFFNNKNHNDLLKDLEWYNSGEGFITSDIQAGYSSILDLSKQYKIRVSYKIYKDKIILLRSD
jgi:hypothetical protein